MDKILLNGLKFWARHGVYQEEKLSPQEFAVDISIDLDLKNAAEQDNLALTLDYQKLYEDIKELMEGTSYGLLETLAEKIAELALACPLAQSVRVRLEKCRARSFDDTFSAAVVIERSRS